MFMNHREQPDLLEETKRTVDEIKQAVSQFSVAKVHRNPNPSVKKQMET